MSVPAYYFGAIGGAGHYLFGPDGAPFYVRAAKTDLPWTEEQIDCKLIPHLKTCREYCGCSSGPQGRAALTHKDGWTALGFCDRSVDRRGGSNSNFLMRGTYEFAEALERAKQLFPSIFKRFSFEVILAL